MFAECASLTSVTIPNSVETIYEGAFAECASLTDVYYAGSKEEWNNISVESDNEPLLNAAVHYGPAPATELVKSGDFEGVAKWTIDSGDTLSVTFDENIEGTGVIALLGENGEAEGVTVADGKNAEVSVENAKTVKIFVWNSFAEMKPLCEAKEIKIN
jgi:hypothetical protein